MLTTLQKEPIPTRPLRPVEDFRDSVCAHVSVCVVLRARMSMRVCELSVRVCVEYVCVHVSACVCELSVSVCVSEWYDYVWVGRTLHLRRLCEGER